jgi:Tfp pilus assembly protein PilX
MADQRGVALVVAIMIAGLMLALGIALLSFVDQQANQSGTERVKESSLTLAEGALNAQANLLAASWPNSAANAFVPCTQGSASSSCPDVTTLLGGFTAKEFGTSGSAAAWNVSVRDNALGNFYDDTATASQPAYDANADNMVWLRAQGSVRGQVRTIVALLRAFPIAQNFPRGVVTAGHFKTTNNGKKVIIDPGSGPGVNVRCTPGAGAPTRGDACLDYVATKGQLWPNSYSASATLPSAMSASDISAMRTKAQSAGTWYLNCPSTLPSAPLVFVENGPCSTTSNQQINSAASPGLLMINSGTLTLGGTSNFFGIIYCVNAGGLTGDVVTIGGNAQVQGAVVVDGAGGVAAGSSKTNVVYDPNAFNIINTNSSVAVVANSWRELNGP